MERRRLGRTNLQVSCIGFGGLPLPVVTAGEAKSILNEALDREINFIDTARGYRESEELIGNAVSARRKEYVLATKSKARREDDILREFETSTGFLKTDFIDLYQIHFVNTDEELKDVLGPGGALEVFRRLQDEGSVGHIGITGHRAPVLRTAAETGEFDTVQAALSYIEKEREILDLVEYCADRDIGFIVQKPLAGGAITRTAAGLRWILGHRVSTVIPGMVSVGHVIENTGVGRAPFDLSGEEKAGLDEIAASLDRYFCRRCYYCHPVCPINLRIGSILEFYTKGLQKENLPFSRRWYGVQKVQVDSCTECGACEAECPYELPIIDMLKEAHALLGGA